MRKNGNLKRLVIFAIAAIMCLVSVGTVANAAYVELGNPASTSYESYVPFYGFYDYGWSAVIYLQSELGGAKDINGLTYDVYDAWSGAPYTIYDQKIWMKHTTDTDWVGNYVKPDPIADGYTEVFSGSLTFTGTGFADLVSLDSDFSYDGTDNLIIYWENWDGDYNSGQPRWQYPGSSYAPNRVKYKYSDNAMPGDATSASYYFPNIRLHFPTDHDVAVKDIVMPETVEGYGNIPVHVAVKNVGLNTETFPVNVKINAPPIEFLLEDFEGTYSIRPMPPAGWLVKDMNLDGYISGFYGYNMWGSYSSSSYANSGTMSMRMDYGGTGGDDDWLFTPGVYLNPGTYTLDWYDRMSSSSTSYDNQLEVWIGTTQDNTGMTTMLWNDPAMFHTSHRLDTTPITISSGNTYFIGFYRTNGYSYSNMFIDDVHLYQPGSAIYDQTVTMWDLNPGSVSEANLPDWVVASPGDYEVIATTLLGTDENTMDDMKTQITTVGFVDGSLDSVDFPQTLMGPAPFSPVATVSNLGALDFSSSSVGLLPVHATVLDPSGGTGVVFAEDFEGYTSFNQFEGDVEAYLNPEEVGKSGDYTLINGFINWPDDQPSFGDPGDWTVLNPDNNGAMWHLTDYRSSPVSPTHSMYFGDENTKQYLPYSYDILISPKMHIGTAGGSFSFDMYNDVEGAGYDDVYFGVSADGMSWAWWFGGAWWTDWYSSGSVPIYPWHADTNGDGYLGFLFVSDSSFEYEGAYIDNVEVQGSPYLYDETVYVNLPASGTTQVTFPAFTPQAGYPGYYDLDICCESPDDSVPANDCGSMSFTCNAPVWNDGTGLGYSTIQGAIDDPLTVNGDIIKVNDGDFYEDIIINKGITVSALTPPDCLSGTTYLFGTVDIVADDVIFENFYVHPLTLFTTDEAAIAIYSNNVIVRHNTVEIQGETNGTIKGIHAYAVPSDYKQNIEISDNCVHDVINCATGGGGGGGVYFNDFETNDGGWTISGTPDWQWTNTYNVANYVYGAYPTSEIPPPNAYSGTGLWGTVLYAPYTNAGAYAVLEQTFDFSTLTNAQISWYSWEQVFGNFDYCELYVNGVLEWGPSWDYSAPTWKQRIVDLSAYDGMSSVQIEFRMWATTVVNYAGWYIDDIEIKDSTTRNGYGGADGIMVQGATWNVDVLNNKVYDIHSSGWAYGIEVTPTAVDPETAHFYGYLNFQEDFTGVATGALPTDWTKTPTTTNWGAYASSYSGGVSPEMRFYYSPSSTDDFYVITPEIDTSAFTTLDFSFSHYNNDYNGQYSLRVVALAGGTEYIIEEWANPSGGWGATPESYTLTGAHGVGASDFQIAWVFSGNSFNINYWYFDDVVLFGQYDYYQTVNPWPLDVNIEGNHLYRINLGPGYPCTQDPAYDGIMLTVNYATLPTGGPTPADASEITVYHNWFDSDCFYPALAILNMDLQHCLMAGNNYFSYPDGPGSFDPTGTNFVIDCITGEDANGGGSQIILYGPVHFDPWLGLHAIHNIASPYYATVGVPVVIDGSDSWAKDFTGVYEPEFYWKFDDGSYSMEKMVSHTYTAPGVYEGYLRVHSFGVPEFGIPPQYDWAYFTIIVTSPGAPLGANAGGGSLSQYEVSNGEQLTLSGIASGGTAPYTYQWNLGDGRTVEGQNPTVVYLLDEENPVTTDYTVTLTVIDSNYDTSTDTATVTVLAPEEIHVSINAPANAMTENPVHFTSTVVGGTQPYTYDWSFGDDAISNVQNPTHIFNEAGTYTVSLTVTDDMGITDTTTKTLEIQSAEDQPAEIKQVSGGIRVKATIAAGDNDCDWTMKVEGNFVLFGGEASGTILSGNEETVKLPLTFAFGKVNIKVTANEIQEDYTAFALGPFFLKVTEA